MQNNSRGFGRFNGWIRISPPAAWCCETCRPERSRPTAHVNRRLSVWQICLSWFIVFGRDSLSWLILSGGDARW